MAELLLELSIGDGDVNELDELSHQLKTEIESLSVDSIEHVSKGMSPDGTKALDSVAIGQMLVTLAPSVIPPLFELLKSWIDRKPSTPVKIKVKVGKRTAQVEYDPTKTSAEDLNILVKSLGRNLKR